MTKLSLFHNFTTEEFVGYWNGKAYKFKAGQQKYFESGLAEHFAKHLANRELLKLGKETATSPKNPDQVPDFMEIFNKACIPQADEDEMDATDDLTRRNQPSSNISAPITGPGAEAQVVTPPAGDDESDFEGLSDNKTEEN